MGKNIRVSVQGKIIIPTNKNIIKRKERNAMTTH